MLAHFNVEVFWSPALLIGVATGVATLAGGAAALRLRARLGVLSAFGGGAIVSLALLDLLPDALRLGRGAFPQLTPPLLTLLGFLIYLVVDRSSTAQSAHKWKPALGPLSLILHSFMDGLGIGIAFRLSPSIGATVAAAVLAHDFLDGSNTVALSFSADQNVRHARLWLLANALTPLIGIAASALLSPSVAILSLLLALFAGFLLYIGARELWPRRPKSGASVLEAVSALLGAALIGSITLIGAP